MIGDKGCWIQCRYERLAELCYNCGMIGHSKNLCKLNIAHNQIVDGDMYGPWVRAEADAYTVVTAGSYVKRVEIPMGEIFDTFAGEINQDHKDGETSGKDEDLPIHVEEDDRDTRLELGEGPVSGME